MNKKVFISYSRKDTLDIAEFKTIKKFRDFEIVIDDEEVPFNQLWKDNIRQKINNSDAAICVIEQDKQAHVRWNGSNWTSTTGET